ncbi:MAG: mandelate racemase/muconate lactonizing enzyme family protein [Hyphomicrobiales bacterium]|nr:mandelate racemase/muconate lactonizing enzyme family protein [Hyphomicrobiales bacterium]
MPAIAAIDTIALRIPLDTWAPPPQFAGKPRTHVEMMLVRVATDDGVVGWGEGYGSSVPLIPTVFESWIKHSVIGQDATDPGLTARLERLLHGFGRSGPVIHALSGLDIALWDIRGKLQGVPVSQLLGGARRQRVEAYASLLQYGGSHEHVRRNVARALERGYRHIKLHERTADSVAAAREVAGPNVPIMVDTNCAWTAAEATAPVAALAASKPFWVEEPIWPPEDFASLAQLRRMTGVPLAMGENASGVLDFRKMVAAGATDFVQPSVVKIGGLTNLWQIVTEAERAGVTCVPHAFFFGPGYLATLHAIAAKEKAAPLERLFGDVGFTAYASTVPVVDGAIAVPERPGLGAEPEEEMITRFRV